MRWAFFYRNYDEAFANVSDNSLIVYQSRQFLEYNMRTRMTNRLDAEKTRHDKIKEYKCRVEVPRANGAHHPRVPPVLLRGHRVQQEQHLQEGHGSGMTNPSF